MRGDSFMYFKEALKFHSFTTTISQFVKLTSMLSFKFLEYVMVMTAFVEAVIRTTNF